MKNQQVEMELWRDRVRASEEHAGGYAGYCREIKIREHNLYYWRRKLGRTSHSSRKSSWVSSSFIPVRVAPPGLGLSPMPCLPLAVNYAGLPDPRWLAEVLRALGQSHPIGPGRAEGVLS